jgi:hypothetical protein
MDLQQTDRLAYQSKLDRVVEYATGEQYKQQVALARADFFSHRGGDVFEDDRSMDSRLAGFLEWYVFDRALDGRGMPPTQAFLADNMTEIADAEREDYMDLTRTVHGLFELRRKPKGERLRVRELCRNADFEVLERRQMAGLEKGDLFEARLIPSKGELLFSPAFCYHPREARKAILAEVKRRRKIVAAADPSGSKKAARIDELPLLELLSSMALKFERYRNVNVDAIYNFSPESGRRSPQDANE